MQRVTNLPQTVLSQILSNANARPGSLTPAEIAFARRINNCCLCNWYWVQRFTESPRRCPHCHSTNWNRPFMRALADADSNPTEARNARKET
jgi:hypothetical protein